MGQPRKWTDKENELLISGIRSGKTAAQIAKSLGRSEKSVSKHCENLKIDVVKLKEKKNTVSLLEVDVKCPFFQKLYRGKSVKCEGLTLDPCPEIETEPVPMSTANTLRE